MLKKSKRNIIKKNSKRFIKLFDEILELEEIGVDKFYGYIESDCIEAIAIGLEEVEAQGCEVNITMGKEKKYRVEFVK